MSDPPDQPPQYTRYRAGRSLRPRRPDEDLLDPLSAAARPCGAAATGMA